MSWHLYLDESGDLGFDFESKSPSRYFNVTILATSRDDANTSFKHAVKRTLRNKVNTKTRRRRVETELKGTNTSFVVKKYLWKQIADLRYGIYSLTVDKSRVAPTLRTETVRLYNYIAKLTIQHLPLEMADGPVHLVIDRSKGKRQIAHFNEYLEEQLSERIDPALLRIRHEDSAHVPGLQLVDLFAWGTFRKYERHDSQWFDVYGEKVRVDDVFPRNAQPMHH